MTQTIRERADTVGTLRYVSVFLMETLARWVPTTPELEAKVLFGRHVWEFAQHADALGRRTSELRAAMHYSLRPTDHYAKVLDQLAAVTATADRISRFYDGILPELEARYRQYLAATDVLLDEPTVRIIERALPDFPRMRRDAEATVTEVPALRAESARGASELTARLGAVDPWIAHRPPAATSGTAP